MGGDAEEDKVKAGQESDEIREVESGHSSGSDSEADDVDGGAKRQREQEQLDQDEVEALKNDLGQDHREGKRMRRAAGVETAASKQEATEGEKPSTQSGETWDALKTQTVDAKSSTEDKVAKAEEMVLVKRTYRFAGEVVHEEKMLPASHPDAIAYMTKQNGTPSALPSIPAKGAPGPRKKKSSLAAMSAAATGKPTKINTLEKSKMDWNRFKDQDADEAERDEMEAQTKGGGSGLGSMKGYMERKSFLDRVQGRVEEQRKG